MLVLTSRSILLDPSLKNIPEKIMIKHLVERNLKRVGINVTDELLEKVEEYDRTLMKWNQKINLTAFKEAEERALWLYTESIWAASRFEQIISLIDVGCGCGFPGFAFHWKNNCRLVMIEAREKKTHFLKEIVRLLKMKDVEIRNQRFDGDLSFLDREEKENVNISWRAVNMPPKILSKLIAGLKEKDSLIWFLGKESKDLSWVNSQGGLKCQKREVFPLADNRFVMQMVKCST